MRKNPKGPQRRRRSRPTVAEAPAPPVKVSIVGAPNYGPRGNITLRADVAAAKAALMYADTVEILNPIASLIHAVGLSSASAEPSLRDLIRWTRIVSPEANIPREIDAYLPLVEKHLRSGAVTGNEGTDKGMREVAEFLQGVPKMLSPVVREILGDAEADELKPALDRRLIEVVDFGEGIDACLRAAVGQSKSGFGDSLLAWTKAVESRMNDPRSRLLFDDEAADFFRLGIAEGEIAASPAIFLPGSRSAALGSGFVARLPVFPHAPMDELLDMRDELSGPLTRYRSAVSRLSGGLTAGLGAEMDAAVTAAWEESVAPELVEITELLHDHGLVREMAKHAREDVKRFLVEGSAVVVGFDQLSSIHAAVGALFAASAETAGVAGRAWNSREVVREAARKNEFFYLYEANRRL